MLKTQIVLEVKAGENIYQLHLPSTCALGEVHDVLYKMRSFVIERILDEQKKEAPKEPEKEKPE